MKLKIFISTTALLLISWAIFAQLTLKVTSIPSNTPPDNKIYVAGNFQGWNPGDANSILTKNLDGTYQITITPPAGQVQYKFTRGTWAKVEGNATGTYLPNRTFNYSGTATTAELTIASWEDLGAGGSSNSTAAPNVFALDKAFNMPQLNRTRRIWMYLPQDYEKTQKRYPVLYMHDGQNVFDAATSFAGEWKVDETLNDLHSKGDYGCIVVAIDNGQALRTNELSPWYNNNYKAGGEGEKYMRFIVETLKPYIDANYRTRPERDYTAIMGSSLGGLISHYGILEFKNVISKAGVFSPAYWFNPEINDYTKNMSIDNKMKFYIIAGQKEGSAAFVEGVNAMASTLSSKGLTSDQLKTLIHEDGQHSEWYWAREFAAAFQWLFKDLKLTNTAAENSFGVRVFPNPADSVINVTNVDKLKKAQYKLQSLDGKTLKKGKLETGRIELTNLAPGPYVLQVFSNEELILKERIIKHN